MLLVIFPMFTFPKKLPPRNKKKKKKRKKISLDNVSSDDEITKEKTKSQTVTSSMGFGKDIKGMLYRKQMRSKWHPILCVRAVQSWSWRSETLCFARCSRFIFRSHSLFLSLLVPV